MGTTNRLEGPAAGVDSVILVVTLPTTAWTATSDATWLHLGAGYQSGTGGTNVIFSVDANPGATRTGTLTIAGQTLTVTQAGATYVQTDTITTLFYCGQTGPFGVAVNGAGTVVYTANADNSITQWLAASNTTSTTQYGLAGPQGLRMDGAGNLYIADAFNSAIKEKLAANGNVVPVVTSGLSLPFGEAVDAAGNLYIADNGSGSIYEWSVINGAVTPLVSGLYGPDDVAVDAAGNVYFANTGAQVVTEWSPATRGLTPLVSSGLNYPAGVAVDGAGNVFIADSLNQQIKVWSAATHNVTTLASDVYSVKIAVDDGDNVYVGDTNPHAARELPYAFVDPTPRQEGMAGGSDALPAVVPATQNLLPPFAPYSDQPSWLTITRVTNGVVGFSLAANPGAARTGNIYVLGQAVPINQAGRPVLSVSPAPVNGGMQIAFTTTPGQTNFTVLASTNVALPLSEWTPFGTPVENPPGQYTFTAGPATNSQTFYILRLQ